jgi:RP/EB family microtubule-associated protein
MQGTLHEGRLIRQFQDNIEFLQWVKKYWDAHFANSSYDAVSRRQGTTSAFKHMKREIKTTAPVPTAQPTRTTPLQPTNQSTVRSRVNPMTEQLEVATRERDFYFGKLRDMEIMLDTWEQSPVQPHAMLEELRSVLYKVEEGFEVPE